MRFTAELREQYLEHIRSGERRGAAADQLGLDRIAVRRYIEEHPDFEELVMYAEVDANEHVLEALYQGAISGNVAAAKVWLERTDGAGEKILSKSPRRPDPPPKIDEPEDVTEEDLILNVTPIDPRQRRKRH